MQHVSVPVPLPQKRVGNIVFLITLETGVCSQVVLQLNTPWFKV